MIFLETSVFSKISQKKNQKKQKKEICCFFIIQIISWKLDERARFRGSVGDQIVNLFLKKKPELPFFL